MKALAYDAFPNPATGLEYVTLDRLLAESDVVSLLVSLPNVIVTSHQAFLTHEALANIATTTLKNLDAYCAGAPLENEICYRCLGSGGAKKVDCPHRANGRCHSVT